MRPFIIDEEVFGWYRSNPPSCTNIDVENGEKLRVVKKAAESSGIQLGSLELMPSKEDYRPSFSVYSGKDIEVIISESTEGSTYIENLHKKGELERHGKIRLFNLDGYLKEIGYRCAYDMAKELPSPTNICPPEEVENIRSKTTSEDLINRNIFNFTFTYGIRRIIEK